MRLRYTNRWLSVLVMLLCFAGWSVPLAAVELTQTKKVDNGPMVLADIAPNAFFDVEQKPMGYATAVSRTEKGVYPMVGSGDGEKIVLRSNGADMAAAIQQALEAYDVVVLDGADGAFTVSQSISLKNLKNKTLIGINGATIRTQFFVSDEIRHMLVSARVNEMSTDGGGGMLPNGMVVREQREFAIRSMLYDLYHDSLEAYRESGILSIRECVFPYNSMIHYD